ncbi:MAG: hypothetical protein AAGD09_04425 [Cyanobacteria bacterium P01_F01_bin.56]
MTSGLDPRHQLWLKIANWLETTYLSSQHPVDWSKLSTDIPAVSHDRLRHLSARIQASQDLSKPDRMLLIMLRLWFDVPAADGKTALKQLQHHLNDIERTFVPWKIVLENKKRNRHDSETDPMRLAELYHIDSAQQAFQDAKAGIPAEKRDQFYRGVMKPPSETAVRRNVFPGKAIYGLTRHLIAVDECTGAIQIQSVGEPYQSTLTGLWFDLDYFQSIPQRHYEFQKTSVDGQHVWEHFVINLKADICQKKS